MASEQRATWAEVVVDIRVAGVDRTFHYAVPPALVDTLCIGHRVWVPFGSRHAVEGYVVGLTDQSPTVAGVKSIRSAIEPWPAFSPADLDVARWMARRYVCLLVQALQCFLPPGSGRRRKSPVTERSVHGYRLLLAPEEAARQCEALAVRAPRQAEVLRRLLAAGQGHSLPAATLAANGGYGPLVALRERGFIGQESIRMYRSPGEESLGEKPSRPALTVAQSAAVKAIESALDAKATGTVLLHGVTGSGKTEVYLKVIETCLARGMGAAVLVPEISLTPQTVGRFRARFGRQIAVLHSRLGSGERFDEWSRIRRGEVRLVVGARSAVFAPLKNLGMIIIDEEHEASYKQDETPRYHAREVARERLRRTGGVLVLGSATPSLETFHLASTGGASYVRLPERVAKRPLPKADIVDMRQELLAGNRSMFSRILVSELEATLHRKEQAILLLNRRGFASFLLCRECGTVPRCPQCGVSLTLHQAPDVLQCHYCDYREELPHACPSCTGPYLRPFGAGTQRVEQEVARLFPWARTARMDRDTTARKGDHQRILRAFAARETDILIGTQMIAKGLDFPQVTCVGVVSADTALHFPDFRAAERTFQLLTQVAGRAGRGETEGRVVLQTYTPDHYAVQTAARHDYATFARRELSYRQRTGYPPYVELARLLVTGEDEAEVARTAFALAQGCAAAIDDRKILGPTPAPLARIQGKFRWHLLLKGSESELLTAASRGLLAVKERSPQVSVVVDVGAVSLL